VWAMHSLIMQGKILYWGTSEWSAQEITAAHLAAERYRLIAPVMEQPQYNMFHRQRFEIEYNRIYRDLGLGTTIWSPLASGLLSGKYNKGLPDEQTRLNMEGLEWLKDRTLSEARLKQVQQIEPIAKKLNCSLAQLAIAWCLKNQNVSTVILGASKITQLEENLKSFDVAAKMDDAVMEEIENILQNKPVLEFF
jgi:aryl-alcohol dehydrogenase-like predicted oxidoreductase